MAEIKRNQKDRVLLGYENEYERLAFAGQDAGSPDVRSCVEELAGEFKDFFGIRNTDAAALRREIQKTLDRIRIDGASFDFLRVGEWIDNEAAMACAMAKIKRMSLYEKNDKSVDDAYHIIYFDTEANDYKAVDNGAEAEELPPEPKKPGFFNRGGGRMDVYRAKLSEYNEAVERKKLAEQTAKNNQEYIKKAREEAKLEAASEERTGASVRHVSIHELMETKDGAKGSLRQRLEGAKSFTRRNSKEYTEFLNALNAVSDMWDKADNPENIKNTLEAYDRLEKACNTYLKGHSSKRHSDMGRDRVDIVRDVLNLQRKERKEIESFYNTYSVNNEENKIGVHAEKARRIEINAKSSSIETIGDATSSRLHIKNKGEEVIFTENKVDKTPGPMGIAVRNIESSNLPDRIKNAVMSSLTAAEEMTNKMSEMHEEKDVYNFLKDYNLITTDSEEEKNKWKDCAGSILDAVNVCRQNNNLNIDGLGGMFFAWDPMSPADKANEFQKLKNDMELFCIMSTAATTDVDKADRLDFLRRAGICTDEDISNAPVRKGLENLCKTVSAEAMSQKVGAANAEIDNDRLTDLNVRNIATSVLAEIIGCPDVVAKTQKAVLTGSGAEREGISMEFVRGSQGNALNVTDGQRENMAARENGSLKRKIADLQVLDILSGQVDRHLNNVMFVTDSQGVVTDIKGIDNDMSFGMAGLNNGGKHSINLGSITHIDATTAQNIMNLDREFINYKFKDLLSERETDALWKRISVMQKWLEEPTVHKIPSDNWNSMQWNELARGFCDITTVNGVTSATSVDAKNSNLFFKIGVETLPLTKDSNEKCNYLNNFSNNHNDLKKICEDAQQFEKDVLDNALRAPANTLANTSTVRTAGGPGGLSR